MKFLKSSLPILILCIVFFLMALSALHPLMLYTPDSARYLVWATSLASGEGYKDCTQPEPTHYVVHAPLYSLLLTPGAFFFPKSIVIAKVMTVLFGMFFLCVFFVWVRKELEIILAFVASLILVFHPSLLVYSTQILSDVPFALCVVMSLILVNKCIQNELLYREKHYLIAVLTAALLLRDVGLTVVLSAALFFWMHRRRLDAGVILFVPLFFFLVWYAWNEIYITSIENPPIRNSQIYFSHMLTSQSESLLAEFRSRLWNNLLIYKDEMLNLLFVPDFDQRVLPLVSQGNPLNVSVASYLQYFRLFIIAVPMMTVGVGVVAEWRARKAVPYQVVFVVCYLTPILLYPIHDHRFLFPLLPILVYSLMYGSRTVYHIGVRYGKSRLVSFILIGLFIVLMIPQGVWLAEFIRNNRVYGNSPELMKRENQHQYPQVYARPLHLAGQWIQDHQKEPVNILCRWKELGLMIGDSKVVEAYPQISPDAFDYALRDYAIQYLVGVKSKVGLNEFEYLMNRSERFSFRLLTRIADLEVFEVYANNMRKPRRILGFDEPDTVRSHFQRALEIIEDDPQGAEAALRQIPVRKGGYSDILMQIGVAQEFFGAWDTARVQFEQFRSMQQAGGFVQQASFHLSIIAELKSLSSLPTKEQKAQVYQRLGQSYWNLGYRKTALRMLLQSLSSDAKNYPSLILSSIYFFLSGDTVASQKWLCKAEEIDDQNVYVREMRNIFSSSCSVYAPSLECARALNRMGLRDAAIDVILNVLRKKEEDVESMQFLAELFEAKQRYQPARKLFMKIHLRHPENGEALESLKRLESKF